MSSRDLTSFPKMPNLGARVFIEGNCFRSGIQAMFAMAGCTGTDNLMEADLVVFSGGEDINPGLYGHRAISCTHFNTARDNRCDEIFDACGVEGIPMFGICRGMQYLHAKAGGELYQDVRNHAGSNHYITLCEDTPVFDKNNISFLSSSLHHQMCMADRNMCIPLAYASQPGRGEEYRSVSAESGVESTLCSNKHLDLEAAAYPQINAAAVQGHPELLSSSQGQFIRWSLLICEQLLYDGFKLSSLGNTGKIETRLPVIPDIFNQPEQKES